MIKIIILVLSFIPIWVQAQIDDHCNIEILRITNKIGLTEPDFISILGSIDSICLNNVEFSEFINETLFMILDGSPLMVIQTIEKYKSFLHLELIQNEIQNPLHDSIDLKAIRLKILSLPYECSFKFDIIKSLDIAIAKYND